ncbi:hypothetical protein FDP41_012013 [Naegleria fowleri]|uniref:Exostosin GT47 domain-containing protein n=1 Tax=Naegleria fowleri TaxID=5763 RepID=A0A6A5C5R7_NAEFO|nr:uncharacterized protein FDP41_012013 [Naegleria fowleri]KAF0982152.1 hypothetical protein FDP41_012013 [Naegleria fowleri]CAG4717739.1 unnamed protein product [Naegleria fowleri]
MRASSLVKLLGLCILFLAIVFLVFSFFHHQKRATTVSSSLKNNYLLSTKKKESKKCISSLLNVTDDDFQKTTLLSDDELTRLSNGLPILFQSFVNVDEKVKKYMNSVVKRHSHHRHVELTREEMLNYFYEGRIWKKDSCHSTESTTTNTPFHSSLVIPADYLVKNYEQVKTLLTTNDRNDGEMHDSYILRYKDIHSFWDNDYSTILEHKARTIVGESCWNTRLVFFSPMWQIFHSGGPRKVGVTLISALKLIRKPFKFIYNLSDPELLQADVIYSYNPYKNAEIVPKILQALEFYSTRNNSATTTRESSSFINPNLQMFIGPVVALDIIQNQYSKLGNRLTYLAASHWIKNEYESQLSNTQTRVMVLPTAINTKLWSPPYSISSSSSTGFNIISNMEQQPPQSTFQRKDVLLYVKNCPFDVNHIRSLLKQSLTSFSSSSSTTSLSNENHAHRSPAFPDVETHEISYQHKYSEEYFWNLLSHKIRFAVVCTALETQGIALQEIMSMDIPLFVLWKPMHSSTLKQDQSFDETTKTMRNLKELPEPISVPYFVEGVTGMICRDLTKFPHLLQFEFIPKLPKFQPRKVMIDWFNYFDIAVEFLKIICRREDSTTTTQERTTNAAARTRFETFESYLKMVRNIQFHTHGT